MLWVAELFLLTTTLVAAQDQITILGREKPTPKIHSECPERSGKFPDVEQCDKFYTCRKGNATIEYCPEGKLFDYKIRNREKCVLPHKVECGNRLSVQLPTPGIDPKCLNANGIFNWNRGDGEEVAVCDKYIQCDGGLAYEFPCAGGLVFDVTQGTCVRESELKAGARHCDQVKNKSQAEKDGFTCPSGDKVGPNGLKQAHPIYEHPTECNAYFVCFSGKDPHMFGCKDPTIFDPVSQVCVDVESEKAPDHCRCYWEKDCTAECPCSCKTQNDPCTDECPCDYLS